MPERDRLGLLYFVIAGLDPAIHVDPRVKPEGDEEESGDL
jgi:hypothetical protein